MNQYPFAPMLQSAGYTNPLELWAARGSRRTWGSRSRNAVPSEPLQKEHRGRPTNAAGFANANPRSACGPSGPYDMVRPASHRASARLLYHLLGTVFHKIVDSPCPPKATRPASETWPRGPREPRHRFHSRKVLRRMAKIFGFGPRGEPSDSRIAQEVFPEARGSEPEAPGTSPSKVTRCRTHCDSAACRAPADAARQGHIVFPCSWDRRSQPASAGFVSVAGSLQGPAGARDMLPPGLGEIGRLGRAAPGTASPESRGLEHGAPITSLVPAPPD
jgi:hypothetical protein